MVSSFLIKLLRSPSLFMWQERETPFSRTSSLLFPKRHSFPFFFVSLLENLSAKSANTRPLWQCRPNLFGSLFLNVYHIYTIKLVYSFITQSFNHFNIIRIVSVCKYVKLKTNKSSRRLKLLKKEQRLMSVKQFSCDPIVVAILSLVSEFRDQPVSVFWLLY